MVHFNDEYGWADKPFVPEGPEFLPPPPLGNRLKSGREAKAERRRQEAWALREWQDDWQRTVQQFLILGIGPPIALLVFGFASMWVIAGFRQPTK